LPAATFPPTVDHAGQQRDTNPMPVNAKFKRQYDWSRKLLREATDENFKAVLNTLYHVYPISFENKDFQQAIRRKYARHMGNFDLFSLNMARLFRRSGALKVAICCMPKSGSTYLLSSLKRVEDLKLEPIYLQTPYMNVDFVDALSREHEVDELALLINEIRGVNWLTQMHVKWTPYTEKIFEVNGVKPIITYRNIFDCLVSMDDMLVKGEVEGFPMIRLPQNYRKLPESERLAFLCDYVGPWYLDYMVSWSRVKLPTLQLHYDEDIQGFSEKTAEALRAFVGRDEVPLEAYLTAFDISDEKKRKSARFNKGVSGRGEKIPLAARERLKALTWPYRDEVDFSRVL
jgi:hypothetical protein